MMVRKVQLEFCSESKLFAPSDDILTLQRYELFLRFPNLCVIIFVYGVKNGSIHPSSLFHQPSYKTGASPC